jgi:uncharacterized protein (TIGR00369 family)
LSTTGTNFGSYVGINDYRTEGDEVVVTMPVHDRHLNQLGLVHGGAIATLADNSMGSACFLAVQKPAVTVEFKLSFMRPCHGGTLIARSRVNKMGEHLVFVECEVADDRGSAIAKALGTYMIVTKVP